MTSCLTERERGRGEGRGDWSKAKKKRACVTWRLRKQTWHKSGRGSEGISTERYAGQLWVKALWTLKVWCPDTALDPLMSKSSVRANSVPPGCLNPPIMSLRGIKEAKASLSLPSATFRSLTGKESYTACFSWSFQYCTACTHRRKDMHTMTEASKNRSISISIQTSPQSLAALPHRLTFQS